MNPVWRSYFSKGWFNHQLEDNLRLSSRFCHASNFRAKTHVSCLLSFWFFVAGSTTRETCPLQLPCNWWINIDHCMFENMGTFHVFLHVSSFTNCCWKLSDSSGFQHIPDLLEGASCVGFGFNLSALGIAPGNQGMPTRVQRDLDRSRRDLGMFWDGKTPRKSWQMKV